MDDLIKRLRRNSGWRDANGQCITDPALLTEASDRIAELEARFNVLDPATVERVTKAILFEDWGSTEGWQEDTNLGKAAIRAFKTGADHG